MLRTSDFNKITKRGRDLDKVNEVEKMFNVRVLKNLCWQRSQLTDFVFQLKENTLPTWSSEFVNFPITVKS